jgi:hypothetical protein
MREVDFRVRMRLPNVVYVACVWLVLVGRRLRYGYSFRRIRVGQGQYAVVDADDYERLNKYSWICDKGGTTYYARRRIRIAKGKRRSIMMHRDILPVPKGMHVDHINHNGLDNRKANLRPATRKQNMWNRRKLSRKYSSKYVGVYKRFDKWMAGLRVDGKYVCVGRFDDEKEAARAYDRAAKKYHSEFAYLNFPEK